MSQCAVSGMVTFENGEVVSPPSPIGPSSFGEHDFIGTHNSYYILNLRTSPHDHSSTHDRLLMTAKTPPSTHMSRITSSSPHKPTILKPNAGPTFQCGLGEAHIEILGHIEFQCGGSKIQDFTGPLGEESWIMDLGSAILKFNMVSIFQYGPH